ncbi:MAG: hypothetical protein WC312_01640 [Candidatus Omnitrophota bacterium]|jgi:type II secretory pathway component PulK
MKNERAGILIFVLWTLIILSLFGIAVSYNSTADIRLAKYESAAIKSLYLARAGMAKALAEFNKDKNDHDSLNESWNKPKEFRFGGGKVVYSAYDESARVNLNSPFLNKEHLDRLGLNDAVSQGLLDYKIKKGEKGFEFMEELFLLDGFTRADYSKIENNVTIYRGVDPRVNINTAGENILNIALGNDQMIKKIMEYIRGDDARAGTEDDGVFTEDNFNIVFGDFGAGTEYIAHYRALFSVKSNFFRVSAEASFPENENKSKRITAVIDRLGKIYHWKEE